MTDFNQYQSPFSWRYSSAEMRSLWGETHKRFLWRKMWLSLAKAEMEFDLVLPAQVEELERNLANIDMDRALQIEAEIHHDLMAELRVFAEQCPTAAGIIHLGATSMDVEDNADALRQKEAQELLLIKLSSLLTLFAEKIIEWKDIPIIAYTHLQPAEPTTLGYRFAVYAQDLWTDWLTLSSFLIKGKGFTGAVGSSASYSELIGKDNLAFFNKHLSDYLGLPFFPITTQVYPRKQDYLLLCALSSIGASLYKFAFDLRFLQTPSIGELSEHFAEKQVGSSAMPFKKNPIQAEKINSLSRILSEMPSIAWQNEANSYLERTLDDSANRRLLIPEAFLICDEILLTATKVLKKLQVDKKRIEYNLNQFAPFAGTERLMMALVKLGANRQEMHSHLREHALQAWKTMQYGSPNPLIQLILDDPFIQNLLSPEKIHEMMKIEDYLGDVSKRAQNFAAMILEGLAADTPQPLA
jgi:adenylosuccinate lyase